MQGDLRHDLPPQTLRISLDCPLLHILRFRQSPVRYGAMIPLVDSGIVSESGAMNLLFRVLYAQKCTSTHHKLVMDALRYLRSSPMEDWQRLFLSQVQQFMDGAKAPDKKFRDFRNHVLHVADNFWGGAVPTAETWYQRYVDRLQHHDWPRAVYCAGVLSHYISDPFMPLHTGQTEDEGQVHRFIEWGTAKIYEELVASVEAARGLQNWSPPETAASADWLPLLIIDGAQKAHAHYDVMIDHYDPALGKSDAASGFDDVSRASLAGLLGGCIKALAFVFDQGIADAGVSPPRRSLSVATVLSGVSTPLFWITRKLTDRKDRDTVKRIWDELQATGKVIKTLPADDRAIRRAHAEEVLGIAVEELDRQPVRKAGSQHQPPQDRTHEPPPTTPIRIPERTPFHLQLDSPVVDAPSIGPKTAKRLERIEILTVADLVDAIADDAADQLDQRWITAELFTKWQNQSILMCRVPGLRGHDAQLLVEVGITRPEELQTADANRLLQQITEFAATSQGQRIIRDGAAPDAREISHWINLSGQSRLLRAA